MCHTLLSWKPHPPFPAHPEVELKTCRTTRRPFASPADDWNHCSERQLSSQRAREKGRGTRHCRPNSWRAALRLTRRTSARTPRQVRTDGDRSRPPRPAGARLWNAPPASDATGRTCPPVRRPLGLRRTPDTSPRDLVLQSFFNRSLCRVARKVQNQTQGLRPNLSGIKRCVEKDNLAASEMGATSLFNKEGGSRRLRS